MYSIMKNSKLIKLKLIINFWIIVEYIKSNYLPGVKESKKESEKEKEKEARNQKTLIRGLKSAKPLSKLSVSTNKRERVTTPKQKSKLQINKPINHKNDLLNKTAKHSEKKHIKFTKDNKEVKEAKERKEKEKKESSERTRRLSIVGIFLPCSQA